MSSHGNFLSVLFLLASVPCLTSALSPGCFGTAPLQPQPGGDHTVHLAVVDPHVGLVNRYGYYITL